MEQKIKNNPKKGFYQTPMLGFEAVELENGIATNSVIVNPEGPGGSLNPDIVDWQESHDSNDHNFEL